MESTKRRNGFVARSRRRLGNLLHPGVEIFSAPDGIQVEWDIPVTVRDGATLRLNVFRPANNVPAPVIMSAHPYGKDQIAARTKDGHGVNFQYRIFPQPQPVTFSDWTSWEAPDPTVWVPRGYAVVNADLRGGGTSDGIGALLSDEEAQDYYDLIEWVSAQPWCTGKVGLDGVSYLAISQYKVAALRPPHLAAICPWEGFSDLYRDFARPGGVREDGFSILWSKATSKAARISNDVRKEITERTERDEWYASVTPMLEKIEVPILVCGSFSDHSLHSRGSFEVFRRAGSARKWLYTHRSGKWCEYYSEAATQTRIKFFDHALKGIDNGWQNEASVRLAIYEEGPDAVSITKEASWPPKDLTWTKLSLDAASYSLSATEAQPSTTSFSMPRGEVSFTWVIPQEMDIIGPMALRLFLGLDGAEDASLFAGVHKYRDNEEVLFEGSFGFAYDMVSKGWQRVAHRRLDERLSTPSQPVHTHDRAEPLQSGEIVAVDIALLPHATRFREGDQLRVTLRGSWHFARDPLRGQFPTGYQASPRATCTLHTGGDHGAYLLLGHRPV